MLEQNAVYNTTEKKHSHCHSMYCNHQVTVKTSTEFVCTDVFCASLGIADSDLLIS